MTLSLADLLKLRDQYNDLPFDVGTAVNQQVSGSMNESFEVRDCKLGKGLFARRLIEVGELILPFGGLVITTSQGLEKGEKQSDPLQVGSDRYIDLQDPGRCANHSCDPNAGVNRDLQLVALRNIQPGEEICYDYSTTMGDGLWEIPCHCGSKNCRGRIRDFRFLPNERQEYYLRLGVVQPYLAVNVVRSFSLL